MDLMSFGAKVATIFIPMLFSLCVHEFAHAMVAKWRGDNTAEMMGRLTINPIPHVDLVGTIILPLSILFFNVPLYFGWAKPVPVNPRNLKNPRADMFWIALAGPLSNLILAMLGTILIVVVVAGLVDWSFSQSAITILRSFILINLFLAFFNALPLHPLDGAKVLARFLPTPVNNWLEQNEHLSSLVLMGLVLTGLLHFLVYPVTKVFELMLSVAAGFVG